MLIRVNDPIKLCRDHSTDCGSNSIWKLSSRNRVTPVSIQAHLEFVFQEQSYPSLHSGQSLAWDHFRGDINDPCGGIANFCGVIADPCGVIDDPCGVVAIPERCELSPIVLRLAKHYKTLLNIMKHVKHCDTS